MPGVMYYSILQNEFIQVTRLRLLSDSFEIPLDLEVSLFCMNSFLTFACIESHALLSVIKSHVLIIMRNAVETEWLKE